MAPIPKMEYCPRLGEEIKSGGFWRDLFSETLANFLLVATVTLVRQEVLSTGLVTLGIGVAFVWVAIGYGLGDFGGAHMNSAITMAMMIRAEISFVKALFYWLLQTAAALAAYYFVEAILGTTPVGFGFISVTWWQGLLVEALATMILCLAALGTGNIPRKGYIILQSIPVGMAAGVGTIIAFSKTSACMNPTQALAHQIMITIKDNNAVWTYHWYFWAGPMIGAVLAAVFYWIFDVIDPPQVQNTYSTWTYNDAKKQKSMSKEPLTQNRFDEDDYPGSGRRSPPHHSHHGYNAY